VSVVWELEGDCRLYSTAQYKLDLADAERAIETPSHAYAIPITAASTLLVVGHGCLDCAFIDAFLPVMRTLPYNDKKVLCSFFHTTKLNTQVSAIVRKCV
jgi:hypothetical protein